MAAFDLLFVPTTIASSTSPDTETAMDVVYAGGGENWAPTGASTALKLIDASYCDWNTAGLQTTSQQLGLTGWVLSSDGVTPLSTSVPSTATISGVSIQIDGTNVVASVGGTTCQVFAAIKEQLGAGGLYTPNFGGPPQFDDGSVTIDNHGGGAGTYPFSGEIVGQSGALAGLTAANLKTVLRSATCILELLTINDTSSVFDLKFDRIAIRVVGDDGVTSTWNGGRTMVQMPGGGWAACKSRIRGRFAQ